MDSRAGSAFLRQGLSQGRAFAHRQQCALRALALRLLAQAVGNGLQCFEDGRPAMVRLLAKRAVYKRESWSTTGMPNRAPSN